MILFPNQMNRQLNNTLRRSEVSQFFWFRNKVFSIINQTGNTPKVLDQVQKATPSKKLQPVIVDFSPAITPAEFKQQPIDLNGPHDHDAAGLVDLQVQSPMRMIDSHVIESSISSKTKIKKKNLINMINHLHFIGDSISVHIQDETNQGGFLLQAKPGPYRDGKVVLRFDSMNMFDSERHKPLHMIIDQSNALILFPLTMESMTMDSITIKLPEMAYVYGKRKIRRSSCIGVSANIIQGQFQTDGVLENFNPNGLRIGFHRSFPIPNPNQPVLLQLRKGSTLIFSGECQILRSDRTLSSIVFKPIKYIYPELNQCNHTNPRVRLTPLPQIIYEHPLCQKTLQHEIDDISGSGFAAVLQEKESLLIPGMIIPQVILKISEGMNLHCTTKVIYSRRLSKGMKKYGFYILDMPLNDQRHLFDVVSKATDQHFNITGKIDMDSLWELFFYSGFIYPEKFGPISFYSEKLKATYKRLYEEGQDIFTPLTYLDNGKVYAHVSAIKAYEGSWLAHHAAARPMSGKQTGLKLINHAINYVDCLYRLPSSSSGLRYQIYYFQPKNKFTDFFFGDVARQLNNPEIWSINDFAYMNFDIHQTEKALPADWNLDYFSQEDLSILEKHYTSIGGRLMLNGFACAKRVSERANGADIEFIRANIDMNRIQESSIEAIYKHCGLMRKSDLYALKEKNVLKAAILVDRSDLGINMSELLNSIKVLVIDTSLPWPILQEAVNTLGRVYNTNMIQVLTFPIAYLQKQGIAYTKSYRLCVMDTHFYEHYRDLLIERVKIKKSKFIFKFIKHSIIEFLTSRF